MKSLKTFQCLISMIFLSAITIPGALAQDSVSLCKPISQTAALRMVPDKIPMEMETIGVDTKSVIGLEFPDKSRLAFAPLLTSGISSAMRQRYQYVLITETRIRFDRGSLPAGMLGLEMVKSEEPDGATQTLIVRDCFGSQLEKVTLQLDAGAGSSPFALTPKSGKDFELRIGKYAALFSQK